METAMTDTPKHDLRDQTAPKPGVTPTDTDVTFAGAENPKVMPSSGRLVTPAPDNVVEGQNSKM
jgi:hypothetical protein